MTESHVGRPECLADRQLAAARRDPRLTHGQEAVVALDQLKDASERQVRERESHGRMVAWFKWRKSCSATLDDVLGTYRLGRVTGTHRLPFLGTDKLESQPSQLTVC